jgi:hypothetical protein
LLGSESGFTLASVGKGSSRITLGCKSEKEKAALAAKIQTQIVEGVYNEWVASRTAAGDSPKISFEEWFKLYGSVLLS